MAEEHPETPHYSPFRWGWIKQDAPDHSRWLILGISGMPTGPMFFWFDESAVKKMTAQANELLSGIVVPESPEVIDWEQFQKKQGN